MNGTPKWSIRSLIDAILAEPRRCNGRRFANHKIRPNFESLEDRTAPAAGILMNSPTDTGWVPIMPVGANQFDYFQDQQTGSTESDLIGTSTTPMFYIQFDDCGDADPTNDIIAFRLRLGQDDGPVGFSRNLFIGIDVDGDFGMDIYVGVNNQGAADSLAIWDPGPDTNTSPSTTSIQSPPLQTFAETTANYDWSPVDNTIDPGVISTDLNGDGGTDHFLTFALPFNDIANQLAALGHPGVNRDTVVHFVLGTATQDNSINQDIGGLDGGIGSDDPWPETPPTEVDGDPPNDPPVVSTNIPDQFDVDSDGVSVDVSVHFSDPNGDTLTFTAAGLPPGLSIDLNTGVISGILDSSASQGSVYSVTVTADDGNGGMVSDTFNWTVINPPPVAQDDTFTTDQDVPVNGNVLNNNGNGVDSDPDGDVLTVNTMPLVNPSNGSVVLNSDGTFTYTPNSGFTGTDTFTYELVDADGATDTAVVTITVNSTSGDPDITDSFSVHRCGTVYNWFTQQFHEIVTITNTSSAPLTGLVRFVVRDLPAGVTLLNASGFTTDGQPYILLNLGTLNPGQSIDVPMIFSNPSFQTIDFTPQLLEGS